MVDQPPRRYLLCRSSFYARDINILWLDEAGSCSRYHEDFKGNLYPARFHLYRGTDNRFHALLCPNGLSPEEWARVGVDDPPGDWTRAYVAFKNEVPVKRSNHDFTEVA